jgi:hypothetical protein
VGAAERLRRPSRLVRGNSGVFTNAWEQTHDNFSEFVFESIAEGYARRSGPAGKRPYRRGAWLRSPRDQALLPPHADYLMDHARDSAVARRGGLTAYRFALPAGTILVTTEDARAKKGCSAWWLHSASAAGLEKLARLVWHMGTLSTTLCSSRKAGAALLRRLRSGKEGA